MKRLLFDLYQLYKLQTLCYKLYRERDYLMKGLSSCEIVPFSLLILIVHVSVLHIVSCNTVSAGIRAGRSQRSGG